MRTINIGTQGFEDLRLNNDFYVDKSLFIKEWWENRDTVTLIARPRRFGKTLNLDMMKCFFSNQYAGRHDLFCGLQIWSDAKYRNMQGTFPVIFLSFARIKERTAKMAQAAVCRLLTQTCGQFSLLLTSEKLQPFDRERLGRYCRDVSLEECADVLNFLSEMLYRHYGRKVLIFLDEYDTPMQEAFVNGYWDEMSAFVRSIFNSAFKSNPFLERALMTGTTRISKESIFSDLNNLNVITTTSRQYETSFGFTQEEVLQALDEFRLSDQIEQVRYWYDGFTFGTASNIYNPWSILNFLKKKEFAPYWANTSSNGLISYELRISDNDIKQQMELLMNGDTIKSAVDEQIIFNQLDRDPEAIWSLFLAAGYLKIASKIFDGNFYIYELSLTNQEVKIMFHSLIAEWFKPAGASYSEFTKALIQGDTESLTYYLNDILLNVANSFDTRKKVLPGHEPESFYHGLVLGLVATESEYIVTSNRESGIGRYDVVMRPRQSDSRHPRPALIMEFKVYDPQKEKSLKETAQRALVQIRERKYDTDLICQGIAKDSIIHYGMAFRGKEALVLKD